MQWVARRPIRVPPSPSFPHPHQGLTIDNNQLLIIHIFPADANSYVVASHSYDTDIAATANARELYARLWGRAKPEFSKSRAALSHFYMVCTV